VSYSPSLSIDLLSSDSPVMEQPPDQTGLVPPSNKIANGCRTLLAAIGKATEKAAILRATGKSATALTHLDNLSHDLESLLDVTMRIQERTAGFSLSTIPDSTRRHTSTVLLACDTAVTDIDAALEAVANGNPAGKDVEAIQATLRAFTLALSLAIDVVSV